MENTDSETVPSAPAAVPTIPSEPSLPLEPVRATLAREKPSLRRRALLGAASLAGVAAISRLARAGELSPPAGAIGPTGAPLGDLKTKLDASVASLSSKIDTVDSKLGPSPVTVVEPRTPIASLPSSADAQFCITQPGAYCLTGNLTQVPGKVCIKIDADHVDIDGQGFVFIGGGGGGGGGGSSSCIRSSGHQAIELYDCAFKGWQGCCCDMTDCDDVYISDVLLHGCVCSGNPATGIGGALIQCRDRCGLEDCEISSCVGGAVQTGKKSWCFRVTVSDDSSSGARPMILCADDCCVEACEMLGSAGDALVVGNRCLVSECDVRQCDGLAISTGLACVVECCEVVGGTGGGIHCADGCCVEDCTVVGKDAIAIDCGSRCSVTENRVVLCWGISCASECACCDNELSSCSGGPDTSDRTGGAILIHGGFCTCEDNYISSSRVGISVQLDGHSCLVHENVVTGAGAGADPVGGGGAGIVFHDQAFGCTCTCNHLRALPGTPPYVMGSAAHGPIVVLASGDMSGIPGSSHPLANTAS